MTNLYHSFFLSVRIWLVSYQITRIWIGVNDMNEEGEIVNMLNETVNYTNWERSEPKKKNLAIQELYHKCDCVRITLGKEYYATSCSFFLPALCSQRYDIGKYSECQLRG